MYSRSRERFWAKGMEQDKINAYMTLYTALVNVAKAAAPMIPFMTEEIYQNLVCSIDKTAPESVHLCDFPVADEAHIDPELEADMDEVLKAGSTWTCMQKCSQYQEPTADWPVCM